MDGGLRIQPRSSIKDSSRETKRASHEGISDIKNSMTAYVIVQAESHDAAARLFENHPHFTIFPETRLRSWSVCRFRRSDHRLCSGTGSRGTCRDRYGITSASRCDAYTLQELRKRLMFTFIGSRAASRRFACSADLIPPMKHCPIR